MPFAKNYAEIYDLLYKDKDHSAEAIAIHHLIQKYRPGAKTILDLGCGTGDHAIALTKLGYVVTGLDLSADMIDLARKKTALLSSCMGTFVHLSLVRISTLLFHCFM